MKIIFLGTSHGNPEANRFCSSVAVEINEKYYIIDAGAPICTLLLSRGITYRDIGGIFITHNHDDHFFGLIEYTRVVNNSKSFEHLRTPVFIPTRRIFTNVVSFPYRFRLLHTPDRTVYKKYRKGVIFDNGDVKITAIPVKHIHPSYAFLLEAEGKRILFSGDLKRYMPDYPEMLFSTHVDLLVLEAAHTFINTDNVIEKINRSKTDRLIINHINPFRNTPEELVSAFSKINETISCSAAYDGMEIEL